MIQNVRTVTVYFSLFLCAFVLDGVSCLVFVREPQDQVVQFGDPITLHCTVKITTFDVIPSVVWYRNQTGSLPLGDVTNTTAEDTTWHDRTMESILTLPTGKFYSDYEGLYHCVVASPNGRIQSRRALIRGNRMTLPMKIYGQNGTVSADEMVVVVLQGYFLQSDEPIWSVFCSSNMSQSIDVTGFSQQILQRGRLESQALLSVSQKDLNSTSCSRYVILSKLSNTNVSIKFSSGSQLPTQRVVVGPLDAIAKAGSNVTFSCLGNDINTSYQWGKDGHVLDIDTNSQISSSTAGVLEIVNVSNEDSGIYNCSASVRPDHIYSTFIQLKVFAPPSVVLSLSQVSVTEPRHVNVTCEVWGTRPLTVSMLLNAFPQKKLIVMQGNSNIVTHSLGLEDSGYVQCLVSNNFGSSQESSSLLQTQMTSNPTWVLPSVNVSTQTDRTPIETASSRSPRHDSSPSPERQLCSSHGTNQPTAPDSEDDTICLGIAALSGAIAGYVVLLAVIVILVIILCRKRDRYTQAKEIVKTSNQSCTVHPNAVYSENSDSSSQSLQTVHLTHSLPAQLTTRNEQVYDVPVIAGKPPVSHPGSGYQVPRRKSHEDRVSSAYDTSYDLKNLAPSGQSTESDLYVTMQFAT